MSPNDNHVKLNGPIQRYNATSNDERTTSRSFPTAEREYRCIFHGSNAAGHSHEVKLLVELPLSQSEDQTNYIGIYFKRFATVLLTAKNTLSILNWEDPEQNTITKARDNACNEALVKRYFSGMRILQSRRQVTGFIKVKMDVSFQQNHQ